MASIITTTKSRSSLFYKSYRWGVNWGQDEIAVLRYSLDYNHVNMAFKRMQKHRELSYGFSGTLPWTKIISQETIDQVHKVRQFLLNAHCKRVLSRDEITVYTNDIEFRDQLSKFICDNIVGHVRITEAQVCYPDQSVQIREPQHKFRTYFKTRQLSKKTKNQLLQWLAAQGSDIRLGPALNAFVMGYNNPWRLDWLQDYYFIDHNDLGYSTMLNLLVPGTIRKTVSIVAK